jgi:magnesium-protoporphyrin O-methyltransferase
MDSLIHYQTKDVVNVLAGLAARTSRSIVFTYAPRTPLLAAMHAVGRLFPKSDRAPSIVPVATRTLTRLIGESEALWAWRVGHTQRIASGFYTSQALQLIRS